jgi:hypothetical protein
MHPFHWSLWPLFLSSPLVLTGASCVGDDFSRGSGSADSGVADVTKGTASQDRAMGDGDWFQAADADAVSAA